MWSFLLKYSYCVSPHTKRLCHKTTFLQRPVPQLLTLCLTTHKAPLPKDHLSTETNPSISHNVFYHKCLLACQQGNQGDSLLISRQSTNGFSCLLVSMLLWKKQGYKVISTQGITQLPLSAAKLLIGWQSTLWPKCPEHVIPWEVCYPLPAQPAHTPIGILQHMATK